ncbi:MAG: hypothetical protein EA393_15695 [Bacteroidetes bacterium]|nr:MAG: hypothetical protein EA393_15695 [Bacteroidota bacterium]
MKYRQVDKPSDNGKIQSGVFLDFISRTVYFTFIFLTCFMPTLANEPDSVVISGQGSYMIWNPEKSAFRAGRVQGNSWDIENIGLNSVAFGLNTIAAGYTSTAFGVATNASGTNAIAMGRETIAAGVCASALGDRTHASGYSSVAMGRDTKASAWISVAMGNETTASAYNSVVMGRFNNGGGNASEWIETDPLFEIGNGASKMEKSNAFTVLKNGNIGLGNAHPAHAFTIPVTTKTSNTAAKGEGIGIINSMSDSFWNIHMSDFSLRFSFNNSLAGARIDKNGSFVQNSDIRMKTHIKDFDNVLGKLESLKAIEFIYPGDTSLEKHIGFIAQDVLPLFPQLVLKDTEDDYLGINYAGFSVVAIKAIQEQQEIIEMQKEEIQELKDRLLRIEQLLEGN